VLVVVDLGSVARGLTGLHWLLLALGTVFFGLLIAGLALLCAWLVREMRLNQRQRAFLDAVTHEMKTPLASLRLYVETLVRHDPAPADRGQFLQRMREDVERLERSVDQILAAARAEVRLRRRSLATIELPDLLERCAREVRDRYKLPASAVCVDAELPARVRGDPEELELAFCNLLDNAVKYSPTAVEVEVVVRADGEGRIGVEIVDRGVGIPRRELRRIFQPFYRASRDVQRRVAGLGLGLFIVRHLIRRQGGWVTARSEGPGRGSRFLVRLRAAGAPAVSSLPPHLEPHVEHPGG
jgi:signal transduction histidine kinase